MGVKWQKMRLINGNLNHLIKDGFRNQTHRNIALRPFITLWCKFTIVQYLKFDNISEYVTLKIHWFYNFRKSLHAFCTKKIKYGWLIRYTLRECISNLFFSLPFFLHHIKKKNQPLVKNFLVKIKIYTWKEKNVRTSNKHQKINGHCIMTIRNVYTHQS